MNLYIDFDRTLYNTDKLYSDMLKVINNYGITNELFKKSKNDFFSSPILFNFIKLTRYICYNYNIPLSIIDDLLTVIKGGEKYLYDDSYSFLFEMKEEDYNISLLTYGDFNFQMLKLTPLSICDVIDNIIISCKYKFELDLNYKNSIFIDDNPRDILGLLSHGAKKVIRIQRKNSKYCNEKLSNNEISSFQSLKDINI